MVFSILKKFFGKEELPQKEIKISELKPYFDECIKENVMTLDEGLKPLSEAIKNQYDLLKQRLGALKQATLKNDNVHLRERQLMEGNRESYIRATAQFVDQLQQKELTVHTAETFVQSFSEALEAYTQATAKNYMVLQEFFAHESHAVADAIRELKVCTDKITEVLKAVHSDEMMRIHAVIERIENRLHAAHDFDNMIQRKQNDIGVIEKQKLEFAQKLKAMEKSKEIQEFKDYEAKRQELMATMDKLKEGFYQSFSQIQHPLKKFAKQSADKDKYEDTIQLYEQDPVQALLGDTELHLVTILAQLKQAMDTNTLELKDTKREKAYEALNILTNDYLQKFIHEYKPLRDEKLRIDHALRTHKHMQEYNETKYRSEHCDEKIALIQKEITALKEQQAKKVAFDEFKTELVEGFKVVFGVELVIVGN